MKLGISQLVLGDATLEETLDLCRAAGYEAVELVFGNDKDLDVGLGNSELRAVKEKCRSSGVQVTSVIASSRDRGSLLSLEAGERRRYGESVVRALEIAGELDAGAVLLHPGQLGPAGTYDEVWNNVSASLTELAPEAEKRKVAICLENVWNKFLLSPREARQLVDEVGSDWVGIYLDTANMMEYGFPEHWIRALGRRIKRVHLKDYRRSARQFVNLLDGDTDWPLVMSELTRAGYDAPLIHEIPGSREELLDTGDRMRKIASMC